MTLTQLHLIDSIKGKTKRKLEEFGILVFTLVSEMEDKTVLDILESILDRTGYLAQLEEIQTHKTKLVLRILVSFHLWQKTSKIQIHLVL